MKTYIQLICMALIVVINYSCEKKIPVIEHSISGVLYLDHTLQPAANYEVRLQYNSLIYSLRDTKILDECTTDENGRFYLKYVKIAGAGELEIENNGGTALLTEIPVNEDINFSFPIKPFTLIDYNINYSRPLDLDDTVFVYAELWIEKNFHPSIYKLDSIDHHFLMLTHNYQPNKLSFNYGFSEIVYPQIIERLGLINNPFACNILYSSPIGLGLENTIENYYISRSIRSNSDSVGSSYQYFCNAKEYVNEFNAIGEININLPD